MFFRVFLEVITALVVGGHPGPTVPAPACDAALQGPARDAAPRVHAPAPMRLGARPYRGGPRPPKKPPEKRPHDSTWSDIKSRFGGRP